MATNVTRLQSSDYEKLDNFFKKILDDMNRKKIIFLTSIGEIGETNPSKTTFEQYEKRTSRLPFEERYDSEKYKQYNQQYKEAIDATKLYNLYSSREMIPDGFTEEELNLYYKERSRKINEKNTILQNPIIPTYLALHGGRRKYKNTKKSYKSKIRRVKSRKSSRK